MSLKLIEEEFSETKEDEFPCLMYAKHFDKKQILLVTGIHREGVSCNYIGTNVNGVGHSVGYYSKGLSTRSFKPYYGQITIKNR